MAVLLIRIVGLSPPCALATSHGLSGLWGSPVTCSAIELAMLVRGSCTCTLLQCLLESQLDQQQSLQRTCMCTGQVGSLASVSCSSFLCLTAFRARTSTY